MFPSAANDITPAAQPLGRWPRPADGDDEPAGIAALDLVVFVLPALRFVEFNLGGSLYLTDLLLLMLFAGMVACRREGRAVLGKQLPRTFIVLALLWLGALVVTDIVRGTPVGDFARGWSKIVLTITHFSVLYVLLYGNARRIKTYAWGLVAGGILAFLINPGPAGEAYPWKFGLSYPVTVAVFLLASCCRERSFGSSTLAAGVGGLNIALGSRSMGALCFLAAVYLVWRAVVLRREGRSFSKLKIRNAIAVAVVLLFGGWGAVSAYEYAAGTGLLGSDAQDLYARQSSGDYGILIGGRSEILIGLEAAYDSPWLGHGSWAKDPEYVELYRETMELLGYGSGVHEESLDEEANITAHSFILGSMVEAGIMGVIFWSCVAFLAIRAALGIYRVGHPRTPMVVFFLFLLLWDIFFSPYAAYYRFVTPFYVVALMTWLQLGTENRLQSFAAPRPAGMASDSTFP